MAKYEIKPKITVTGTENTSKPGDLTVTEIANVLMRADVQFHIFHFDTRSYAQHKALDKFYSGIIDKSDEIIEVVLGRLNTRLGQVQMKPLSQFSDQTLRSEIDDLHTFSERLFDWANDKNYQDVSNLAAELQQLCNQTKYLLTLD